MSNKNHIICEICNKKFKMMTGSHLKKYHDITLKEYIIKYPGPRFGHNGILIK